MSVLSPKTPLRAPKARESAAHETDGNPGKVPKARVLVPGKDRALQGPGTGCDDEVVSPSFGSGTTDVGQQRCVMAGDAAVVILRRDNSQHLAEERPLGRRSARIGIEDRAGQVLRHGDHWDGDVIGVCEGADIHLTPDARDKGGCIQD